MIDCIKADDVVDGRKVNFIKIDIQGYEYYAFQGMQEILKTNNELKNHIGVLSFWHSRVRRFSR
ncbi:MAG: FkbM family methyltransferase [Sphingobacteriales bacterium]|nr:FkbM family methyltransferase [Sphingobacteriales bacterium]